MSALDALSDHCGILESYVDARGATQKTLPETRQALLAAMGFDAKDAAAARQALADLQMREAERCVPPVYVHYKTSGPLEMKINLNCPTRPVRWRIELESGGVKEGRLVCVEADAMGRLRIDGEMPLGYHTLSLEPGGSLCSLIVTPGKCWLPDGVDGGRRLWGVAAQLYLMRSDTNWGVGDYTDLEHLVRKLSACGADVLGLNPLHAMFADDPEQASPYSPASRLLLNVLYIDVARLAETMDCEPVRTRLASAYFRQSVSRCREAPLVDYSGVAALKLPALREVFECCDREGPAWGAFVAFRTTAGAAFARSCVFLALRSRFAAQSTETADWHRWPEEFRRADSRATLEFEDENAEEVTFQAWLQFIADEQLRRCCEAASGMAVGLYRDLAVGASGGGAETWANPLAVVDAAQVGAPPDLYNPQGQNWGLPPFNPHALRAEGYRSFIELLRANMRHAGGLRIDHVMALQQLYWVPKDHSPAEGAYVRYPLEDLVGILALESHRQECLVVGEDLGTVPAGFRERMEQANVLSYRVLFFEKDQHDVFIAPKVYPKLALAVAGSHDLPTLRAWWQSTDVSLKQQLGLYPGELHAATATKERVADRAALVDLLRREGLADDMELNEEGFVEAAHTLLGRTSSVITMLQIDDLTGEVDPVNVPTTSIEYPNWRRRLSVSLERLTDDPRFLAATEALKVERE